MKAADRIVTKQLDIERFLTLKRMQWLAIFALLEPAQLALVIEKGKLLIETSSDDGTSSIMDSNIETAIK